jgi:integrase
MKKEKLELSWTAKVKQWRKRRTINGKTKTFYLGAGSGRDDAASYAKALAKWRKIESSLPQKRPVRATAEFDEQWRDFLKRQPTSHGLVCLVVSAKFLRELKSFAVNIQRWLDLTTQLQRTVDDETTAAVLNPVKTLDAYIDDYIADQRSRYEHGLKFPDAPQRERISGLRLMSYRYNALLIKAEWKNELLPEDEAGIASLMERFKSKQKLLMTKRKIQPGTLNERLKTLRHVVRWLHRKYLIQSLPREIIDICAAYRVPTTAKALDLDTLHRIWDAASPRLRTYIALGLNCGFYVGDIASLEYSHVKDGFITKSRHKTGIPTRFKLWDVTRILLAQNSNGTGKLTLVTEKGGPLLVIDPLAHGGLGKRWCKIETDLLAVCKRLEIKGVTFSMFRDTSSTRIESIDRSLTDLFDGHKDQRMARFYVDGNQIDHDRMFGALDHAIGELEQFYNLKV